MTRRDALKLALFAALAKLPEPVSPIPLPSPRIMAQRYEMVLDLLRSQLISMDTAARLLQGGDQAA
jgi:hypothetical protein